MSTIKTALAPALLVALWLPPPAAEASERPRPGALDLAGPWSYRLDGPDAGAVWQRIRLPASGAELGLTGAGETLWLEREVALPGDWQERLAPSGLAVLISSSGHGSFEVMAGGRSLGTWRRMAPGTSEAAPEVYAVPADAIGAGDRLRLVLRFEWQAWTPDRARRLEGTLGDGWKLGDLSSLRAEAELRRLEVFNGGLPLMILALLYAAIGVYHLQLFRRDRRCREYLWFGLTAILVAANTLLFTPWLPEIDQLTGVLRRLYDVTGALMVATSIQFLWPFLSRPIPWLLRAYQISFLAAAAVLVVVPVAWVPLAGTLCKAWSLPFLLAVAAVLATELARGNPEARTIAVGGFAIVAAAGVEMGMEVFGRVFDFPLQAIAFTIFALSMAFSLSNRFSRVHLDLDALRLQLEDMVEDRTAEFETANARLKSEIAERELAQEAMRMLERAVEQSIDGILVAGLDEVTLYINQAWARMHGYETFEIFGRRLERFHTADQMDREVRPALAEVQERGSWEGEINHRKKDGTLFPTWMSVTLMRDPEGEPMGYVAVARDIAERRRSVAQKQRIEARLQETEKLRSLAELAGGIAHDYNNLLTGVLVNSSLAVRELPPDSPASDKLVQIGATAERAADLTTQLLTYAGAEALVTASVDLNEWVAESRAELEGAATGVELAVCLAPEPLPIEIDAAQVRRAVVNLIANASAAAKDSGGEISLETGRVTADRSYLAGTYPDEDHPPGDYAFLRVTDTGGGIDEERRGRLFDPFFSAGSTSRGLGLATVLSAVRAHRGMIKVTSLPGEGTTFELLFPAAEQADEEPAAEAAPLGWKGSGTVLVIDDEHIMREVSRSILEQLGFDVLTTGEGAEALELYRRHRGAVRLVLLDRTMPTMSGEEVLEEILALDPEARVVLMSGYKKDAIVRDLSTRGLADFLPKPFRPEELRDKVRGVLELTS